MVNEKTFVKPAKEIDIPKQIVVNGTTFIIVDDDLVHKFGYKTKEQFKYIKTKFFHRRYKGTEIAKTVNSWFTLRRYGARQQSYFAMEHFDEFKALLATNRKHVMPEQIVVNGITFAVVDNDLAHKFGYKNRTSFMSIKRQYQTKHPESKDKIQCWFKREIDIRKGNVLVFNMEHFDELKGLLHSKAGTNRTKNFTITDAKSLDVILAELTKQLQAALDNENKKRAEYEEAKAESGAIRGKYEKILKLLQTRREIDNEIVKIINDKQK